MVLQVRERMRVRKKSQRKREREKVAVVANVRDDGNRWIYQLDKSLENEEAWLYRLEKRVEETKWRSHRNTIYRVPCRLRIVDPTSYEPQILSLGPYHNGKPHLRAMDELKWYYLKSFLSRNPARGLADYLKLVASMEEQTRRAYSEAPQMDSKHWVEMMLLDSCFTLELFLMLEDPDDEEADPIKSTSWMGPIVLTDMLLLENQLPFFLLEKLLEFNSLSSENSQSLPKIALLVFADLMPGKIQDSSLVNISNIHHFLHLLYSCMIPGNLATKCHRSHRLWSRLWSLCINPLLRKLTRKNRSSSSSNSSNSLISKETLLLQWVPSAKNLKDAGVAFRKKTENMTSFMDITFQRGTLEIPPMQIFYQSKLSFRNLIAYEQCYMGMGCPVHLTAYAHLMDCIINTSVDVDILQQEGIITNILGNDDDVAQFFNQLNTNATIQNKSYLSAVFTDVKSHCDKRANKWKASLNHNYFSNPWAIVSVVAAIFLFLLTIMQTVLAFFSYLRPHSP